MPYYDFRGNPISYIDAYNLLNYKVRKYPELQDIHKQRAYKHYKWRKYASNFPKEDRPEGLQSPWYRELADVHQTWKSKNYHKFNWRMKEKNRQTNIKALNRAKYTANRQAALKKLNRAKYAANRQAALKKLNRAKYAANRQAALQRLNRTKP